MAERCHRYQIEKYAEVSRLFYSCFSKGEDQVRCVRFFLQATTRKTSTVCAILTRRLLAQKTNLKTMKMMKSTTKSHVPRIVATGTANVTTARVAWART